MNLASQRKDEHGVASKGRKPGFTWCEWLGHQPHGYSKYDKACLI